MSAIVALIIEQALDNLSEKEARGIIINYLNRADKKHACLIKRKNEEAKRLFAQEQKETREWLISRKSTKI